MKASWQVLNARGAHASYVFVHLLCQPTWQADQLTQYCTVPNAIPHAAHYGAALMTVVPGGGGAGEPGPNATVLQ